MVQRKPEAYAALLQGIGVPVGECATPEQMDTADAFLAELRKTDQRGCRLIDVRYGLHGMVPVTIEGLAGTDAPGPRSDLRHAESYALRRLQKLCAEGHYRN